MTSVRVLGLPPSEDPGVGDASGESSRGGAPGDLTSFEDFIRNISSQVLSAPNPGKSALTSFPSVQGVTLGRIVEVAGVRRRRGKLARVLDPVA